MRRRRKLFDIFRFFGGQINFSSEGTWSVWHLNFAKWCGKFNWIKHKFYGDEKRNSNQNTLHNNSLVDFTSLHNQKYSRNMFEVYSIFSLLTQIFKHVEENVNKKALSVTTKNHEHDNEACQLASNDSSINYKSQNKNFFQADNHFTARFVNASSNDV